MTMLRGYVMPSPNASDGEYGSFAGFAASPVDRPYWEGQGIANTIPALNGFGDETPPDAVVNNMFSAPLPLALGAIAGRLVLGNMRGALIGAGLGYFFRDKFPKFAGYGFRAGEHGGAGGGPVVGSVWRSRARQKRWNAGMSLNGFGLMMGPQQGVTSVPEYGTAEWYAAGGSEGQATHGDSMSTHSDSNAPASSKAPFVIAALIGLKFLLF